LHGAKLHQQCADAVHPEHRLLILRLGCDRTHAWLVHCGPDRPGVRRIGLVRLHKRTNELRMQQHDLVPERFDLARPPMPTPARFQCHSPGWALRQKPDQLIPSESSIRDLPGLCVDPMHLKHSLGNV
jgi:hypothetical protein